MIYEYMKDKYGHRKGVVCATSKIGIGWSLCNKKDRFNRDFALKIAEGRARKYEKIVQEVDEDGYEIKVPDSIYPLFEKMVDRAERYYQEDKASNA